MSITRPAKSLIADRVIDEEFAVDVLSIDFKNPLFSQAPEARELAVKLESENKQQHRLLAEAYLAQKQTSWKTQAAVISELKLLNALRLSVFKDEISKNPKGQILEPWFRVIFPVMR